jgi:hypothetical protein
VPHAAATALLLWEDLTVVPQVYEGQQRLQQGVQPARVKSVGGCLTTTARNGASATAVAAALVPGLHLTRPAVTSTSV